MTDNRRYAAILVAISAAALLGLFAVTAAVGQDLRPGDVLLSRNATNNQSPGWWNHCGIVVGQSQVIESREGLGVVVSSLSEFWQRYPFVAVMRPVCGNVNAMEHAAWALVGARYRKVASVFVIPRAAWRGENCVSVARKAAIVGFGVDPLWHRPDHIWSDSRLALVKMKGVR